MQLHLAKLEGRIADAQTAAHNRYKVVPDRAQQRAPLRALFITTNKQGDN